MDNWSKFWGYILALILGIALDEFFKNLGNNSGYIWMIRIWSVFDWWITLLLLILWTLMVIYNFMRGDYKKKK